MTLDEIMTRADKLTDAQRGKIVEAPSSARGILLRAFEGKSRTAAIKAFCLTCVGFKRADVTSCSSLGCPLHPYRPEFVGRTEEDDDVAPE